MMGEPLEPLRALFAGRPAALERLLPLLDRVLGARHPVLIEGERGAGTALVARVIHAAGPARRGQLVTFDPIAPRTDGRQGGLAAALAAAAGGTVVIEEVAALPPGDQSSLLAALRAPDASARIVATTRLDPGRVRAWLGADLLDRLAVLRLRLPPLREEPAGVVALLRAELTRLRAPEPPPELDEDALAALRAYSWPGNADEVERCARALAGWSGRRVGRDEVARFLALLADAPPQPATPAPAAGPEKTLAELERLEIEARLAQHGWRQVETAASLGIDRKTLYRKVRALGLTPPR